MRAGLIRGSYGVISTVSWASTVPEEPNEFNFFIPNPPALADFRLGYTWQYGLFHPEHVLTYNNFQYEDRTEESKWPGATFQIFKQVEDVTPTLYLGLDKELTNDQLKLYFVIVQIASEHQGL